MINRPGKDYKCVDMQIELIEWKPYKNCIGLYQMQKDFLLVSINSLR